MVSAVEKPVYLIRVCIEENAGNLLMRNRHMPSRGHLSEKMAE